MFSIGDKVVYPSYGAGTITDIEEKVVDGNIHQYYALNIPVGNLRILVSVANAQKVGIRPCCEQDQLIGLLRDVQDKPIVMSDDWNQRYKDNIEKIKSGNVALVAEVFRALRQRERERGLSSAEKKVLSTAKQIILSEIILSHGVERPKAEDILDGAIS